MANNPGIGDYSELLSATAGARGAVPIKAEDIANAHRSALEMTKTLGEVKSYLSGRVVTQKLFENLAKSKPADLGKLGVDTGELQANYNSALESAGREAQSIVQGAREGVGRLVTDVDQQRLSMPVRSSAGAEIPNPAFNEPNIPSASLDSRAISKPLTNVSEDLGENLAETSFGSTVRQSIGSAIGKAGRVVKAGADAGAEGGGVATEVGEGASILDGIPGVDVLGVVVGLGATLYGAFHHVKEPKPADGVHIAPVMGVE